MGKTSNIAKQKWNSAHYVQIKAHIKPEIASDFKAACVASGTTMASELSAFMEEFANQQQGALSPTKVKALGYRRERFANPQQNALSLIKVKTLGDRRKAMSLVINLLTELHDAEEVFLENMPENLHSSLRYEMAEERLEKLSDALEVTDGIYDQ